MGPYAIQNWYEYDRQIEIEGIASQIKSKLSAEMFVAIDTLSCVVPNLGKLLFPVLDGGYKLQNKWGDINLKKVSNGHNSI